MRSACSHHCGYTTIAELELENKAWLTPECLIRVHIFLGFKNVGESFEE